MAKRYLISADAPVTGLGLAAAILNTPCLGSFSAYIQEEGSKGASSTLIQVHEFHVTSGGAHPSDSEITMKGEANLDLDPRGGPVAVMIKLWPSHEGAFIGWLEPVPAAE